MSQDERPSSDGGPSSEMDPSTEGTPSSQKDPASQKGRRRALRTDRLAKVLARHGVASRRAAERMIEDGRVTVDGELVLHPGEPVDPRHEEVRVDGKPLPEPPRLLYVAAFKPRGLITSRDDPEGRPSVHQLVEGLPERLEPVGRLDMDTEGLLLFTNDGELAHALTHPSNEVPRRYMAKVWRTPDRKAMRRIRRGVKLDDGHTGSCRARVVDSTDTGNAWVEITVTEGRNRLVRRLFEAVGHPVAKLRRESFGTVSLRGLERGQIRQLTGEEVARLKDIAEGKSPSEAGQGFRYKPGFAKPKPKRNKPLSRKRRTRHGGSKGGSKGGRGRGRR